MAQSIIIAIISSLYLLCSPSPFYLLPLSAISHYTSYIDQFHLFPFRTMAFTGTQQKCTACDKTVYLVDKLTADNRIYHKACFRCHHCKGTLKLGNYNSFEGVLYCRPHFDQTFKRTGSLDKSFEGTPKIVKPEKPIVSENASSNISTKFAGTREKCVGCSKAVYPIEKVTVNATAYHKTCFKCSHGGCTISPSNYIAHEGRLYCKPHHIQLVKKTGNYSQLESDLENLESEEYTAEILKA